MSDIEADLRQAAAAVARAEADVERCKDARNELMRNARKEGLTWRKIAEAVGMTDHGVRGAVGYQRSGPAESEGQETPLGEP